MGSGTDEPTPNWPDCTCAQDRYPQNSENEKFFCQFGANCAPGSRFPNGCPEREGVQKCVRPKGTHLSNFVKNFKGPLQMVRKQGFFFGATFGWFETEILVFFQKTVYFLVY